MTWVAVNELARTSKNREIFMEDSCNNGRKWKPYNRFFERLVLSQEYKLIIKHF